jgi:hypothetical protein
MCAFDSRDWAALKFEGLHLFRRALSLLSSGLIILGEVLTALTLDNLYQMKPRLDEGQAGF